MGACMLDRAPVTRPGRDAGLERSLWVCRRGEGTGNRVKRFKNRQDKQCGVKVGHPEKHLLLCVRGMLSGRFRCRRERMTG